LFFLLDPRTSAGAGQKNQKIKALKKFSRVIALAALKFVNSPASGGLKHTNFGHYASLRTFIKFL
jgi:hypothetical protein